MNPRLDAALGYAARGWPVIPLHNVLAGGGCSCRRDGCGTPAKHPRTQHGLTDASADPAVIRRWWKRWPDANIGIVTGATSGVWVVGPDGDEGVRDLERLAAEHGPLPRTYTVRSGSGGRHLYFRWPADGKPIPNRKNHRGLKVDVRACGDGPGYVVAPPSANANGRYEVVTDAPVADAPDWMVRWCRTTTPKTSNPSDRPTDVERARRYLAKVPGAVAGEGGHSQTFAAARALVWGFDLPAATALHLLRTEYNPRCRPPWSDKELEHKVAEADTKDFGKPRGYLRDAGSARPEGAAKGPAPAPEPPGWDGPPAPLPVLSAVPPFPVWLFPRPVAAYWEAAARALGVPVDYVAVPGLALLGAAVGRSRAIALKTSYSEPPALWVVVIAPPGSTKSASLALATAPLAWAEQRWLTEYKDRESVFDVEMDRYAEQMKGWKKNGCEGEPPTKPTRPTLRQAVLDNATVESVAKVLADNPRGVVLVKDELIGFVGGMNQYRPGGRGDDRQFYLSAWAGARAKKNRAGSHDAGPLVIPHPFFAVAGMMCPDSLPALRGDFRDAAGAADGFVDRFLFSFPDPLPATAETWDEVPDDLRQGYADLFSDLLGVAMVEEPDGSGGTASRAYFVHLAEDAKREWERFTAEIAAKKNALDPLDSFAGVLNKLKGYALRIAGVMWAVKRACDDLSPNAPLDADTLRAATVVVDYFERHARRCLGVGVHDRAGRVVRRLVDWLARTPGLATFTRTQAFNQLKDARDVREGSHLDKPLALAADYGYIRLVAGEPTGRPGPVPQTWAVNPLWVRSAPEGRHERSDDHDHQAA